MRKEIEFLGKFDAIVLGSIGPVFGNCSETLTAMDAHLEDEGIVVLDDGYAGDEKDPNLPSRNSLLEQIERTGMKLLDEMSADDCERIHQYEIELRNLTKRCRELIQRCPDKKSLFEEYIEKQRREYEVLETEVICSTLVIGGK